MVEHDRDHRAGQQRRRRGVLHLRQHTGTLSVDGDLYIQEHRTKDPQRREPAGPGRDFTFHTKTAIALEQAQRAVAVGVAVDWAAGDEVYGRSAKLRGFFEERHRLRLRRRRQLRCAPSIGPIRADVLAAKKVPQRAWNRLSCGQGAKGVKGAMRLRLAALVATADPTDLSYFYAYAPEGRSMALADLVAGQTGLSKHALMCDFSRTRP